MLGYIGRDVGLCRRRCRPIWAEMKTYIGGDVGQYRWRCGAI